MSQTKAQLIGDLTQALEFTTTASTPADGLYLKATNQLALATNSIDRITAGTSELVINESGASVDFRVEGDTNANLLFVDASTDRVGIGTSSPNTALEISSAGDTEVRITGNGGNSDNDTNSELSFNNSTGGVTARIRHLTGVGGVQSGKGQLAFFVDNGSSLLERLRINEDGNVGIKDTSPSASLQVNGSWVDSYGTVNITGPDDGLVGVGLRNSSTYLGGVFFRDGTAGDFLELNAQGSRSIRALVNGSEALRIDSSSRLLIGRTGAPANDQGNVSRLTIQGYVGGTSDLGLLSLQRGEGNSSITEGEVLGRVSFNSSEGNSYCYIQGVADGDGGTNDYPGRLAFFTNVDGGAGIHERMRIDSSGQVGIGGSAPESSALLGIQTASTAELSNSSGLYNQSNPAFFQIKNTTDDISDPECGIILQPRNSSNGAVALFAKRKANFSSDLIYRVRTGSSTSQENLRFLHSGGITFNADTADANALDDYEEGTWQPTFQGESNNNNPTITYTARKARYTKIGRLVSLQGYIQTSAVSNTGTAYLQIGNLPFTVGIDTDTDYTSSLVVGNAGNYNNSHPNGGYLRESQNGIYLTRHGGTSWELIETNHLQNSSFIHFSINYITSQ